MKIHPATIVIFLMTSPSYGTITYNGSSGRSWETNVTNQTTTPSTGGTTTPSTSQTITIYGGTAGTDCTNVANTANSDGTCNSCKGNGTAECNANRITNTTNLFINFSSNSGSGYPVIQVNQTSGVTTLNSTQATTVIGANGAAQVIVPWQNICSALNSGGGNCEGLSNPLTGTFTIGLSSVQGGTGGTLSDSMQITITVVPRVDPGGLNVVSCPGGSPVPASGTGACDFTLFPGDGKLYVTDLVVPSNFPTTAGGSTFAALRFFVGTGSAPNGYDGQLVMDPVDLTVQSGQTGSANLATDYIDNLSNGTDYFVTMASVDLARNLSYYVLNNTSMKPSEVAGLLAKKLNCFIATAAYGSPFADKVETFRNFRDRFLHTNHLGRQFVKWYYKHSPYWADKIRNSENMRAVTRVGLWPLWAFSWMALHWGIAFAAFIAAMVLASVILGARLILKKRIA